MIDGHRVSAADTMSEDLASAVAFIRSIGLSVHFEAGVSGFMPGIRIASGTLIIDPTVCLVSNLLHEAGHIAIVPLRYRSWMSGNLAAGIRAMLDDASMKCVTVEDLDGPLYRAVMQASDPEATAWAWAAGQHLGLAPNKIIMDTEYDGDGAFVRLQLSSRGYAGIHGLSHAGFCATTPASGRARGIPAYPDLLWWTQQA